MLTLVLCPECGRVFPVNGCGTCRKCGAVVVDQRGCKGRFLKRMLRRQRVTYIKTIENRYYRIVVEWWP